MSDMFVIILIFAALVTHDSRLFLPNALKAQTKELSYHLPLLSVLFSLTIRFGYS